MATILVVDDRPSNRQFLTTLLGYSGHRLLEAADGAQALELTRAAKPDLVITDILMPNMDGFEYVQTLRNDPELAPTPVIFYTATYSAPEARALARSCGVEIVLPKPCEPQEILTAVNKALGVEATVAALSAADKRGIAEAGGLGRPDDTNKRYVRDLQAVKLGFDEVIEHSEKLIAQRDLARGLSKKLSTNVDSLQRVMSRLSALVEVGMEMEPERDPAKLVHLFFAAACDIVESKYAVVAILEERETAFGHVYAKGLEPDIYKAADNGRAGLLGSLLSGHRAIRARSTNATAGAEGLPAGHPPVRNILAVPVGSAARIYGWLYFADKPGEKEFSAEDERLASIMATKLALLYDNLMMYDAVQRHAATLQLEAAERRRAQDALRESEAGLHRAQAIAKLAHVITGSKGEFLSWSATLPELVALETSVMPGSTREWLELIHPDDRGKFRDTAIDAGETGARREIEYRLRRGDDWIYLRQILEPLAGDSATQGVRRWFNTIQDVTAQKLSDLELRRFRLAMDISGDAILLVDRTSMRYIDVNQTFCDLVGYRRQELLGMTPMDLFGTSRETLERDYDSIVADNNSSANMVEGQYRHKNGSLIPIETRRRALLSNGGWIIVGTARDITDRKRADDRIRRLNRVYAVLSGINTLIVRVHDRAELFREACRISVDAGGFKMAWIGLADQTAMKIVPIASAGADAEFLTLINDRFSLRDDSPMGNTMTARAIREKKAIVSNKMRDDEKVLFSKERAERGISSMAILPLLVSDEAIGVLALYADEIGFFDGEEMKLLHELAGDIAFAVDHLDKAGKLDYLAYYDQLTGLANRTLFNERLAQHTHTADASKGKLAVVVADIERFRMINDSLGRQCGDTLLKQLAQRLVHAVDQNEVARIGPDQFAIVLLEVKGRSEIGRMVEEIWRGCLNEPFRLNDSDIRVAMKGGIAVFPNDGANADTLFRNAEAAWKRAKQTGDRYLFHSPEMTARIAENLALENKLRQALDKEEFVLHYQPKVNLETRRVVGVEALIRWNSPERGLVPPGLFIPLLEETGLILQAGAWALERATFDHGRWLEQGVDAPRIAVNVSAIQLRQRDFVEVVKEAISRGANPTGIDLEITESLLMEDVAENIKKLRALRDLGMKISIDDFGTGYSSLGYLAKLPVHTLKIDRSFIITMLNEPDTMTLVQTIISLAHSLRLNVVAEGVEQEEQAKMLRLLRCDQMQGYLFSRPIPFDQMTALLIDGPKG